MNLVRSTSYNASGVVFRHPLLNTSDETKPWFNVVILQNNNLNNWLDDSEYIDTIIMPSQSDEKQYLYSLEKLINYKSGNYKAGYLSNNSNDTGKFIYHNSGNSNTEFKSIATYVGFTDQQKDGWLYTTKTDGLGTFYSQNDITPILKSIDSDDIDGLPSSRVKIKSQFASSIRFNTNETDIDPLARYTPLNQSDENINDKEDTTNQDEIKISRINKFSYENVTSMRETIPGLNNNTTIINCKKSGRIAGFRFKTGGGRSFIYKKTTSLLGESIYEDAGSGTFIGIKVNKLNTRNNKDVLQRKLDRFIEVRKALENMKKITDSKDRTDMIHYLYKLYLITELDYKNELYKSTDKNGNEISNFEKFTPKTFPIKNAALENLNPLGGTNNEVGFGYNGTEHPQRDFEIVKPIL